MNKLFTVLITTTFLSATQAYALNADSSMVRKSEEKILVLHDQEYELLGSRTHHNPLLFKGFSTVIIPSGDTLTINGDLEIDERTKILVEEGASVMIYGNLRLKGESEIRLEGHMHVLGALNSKHKASVYGKGVLRVIGQSIISHEALVFGTSTDFIDSMVFNCNSSNVSDLAICLEK
jgi:hypothetical protein